MTGQLKNSFKLQRITYPQPLATLSAQKKRLGLWKHKVWYEIDATGVGRFWRKEPSYGNVDHPSYFLSVLYWYKQWFKIKRISMCSLRGHTKKCLSDVSAWCFSMLCSRMPHQRLLYLLHLHVCLSVYNIVATNEPWSARVTLILHACLQVVCKHLFSWILWGKKYHET